MAHKVSQDNVSKNRLRMTKNFDLNRSVTLVLKPVNHPNQVVWITCIINCTNQNINGRYDNGRYNIPYNIRRILYTVDTINGRYNMPALLSCNIQVFHYSPNFIDLIIFYSKLYLKLLDQCAGSTARWKDSESRTVGFKVNVQVRL